MSRVALKRRRAPEKSGSEAGYPGFVEPCHPTLRQQAPAGRGRLHEIKHDGYRAQLHVHDGDVRIYSRNALDWTKELSAIARVARKLSVKEMVVDGEAVVLSRKGVADLQALRRELGNPDSGRLTYYAFDLLYLDGEDLRDAPLIERKTKLERLLRKAPPQLAYAEHLEAEGPQVYQNACELGLEGVVSKRADSSYRSGRQESWIKTKCIKSDTFPIIAFVEKLGAKPRRIASLYIGRRDVDGRLRYAGKVRSGYTESILRQVREKLDPLIAKKSPLDVPVKKEKATWVKPVVLAEIKYSGETDDGLLREAVFKGLRDDLEPTVVRAPALIPPKKSGASRGGVPRENILQLLPDAVVPSKEELADYWRRVWRGALPYLGRRPLKLVRHTRGTTFYHKGRLPPVPEAVHQLRLEKREGGEGVRLWVDSLEGLLGLVEEVGAVELHPWNATVDDIEHADTLVFDLDPGSGIEWQFVVDTALTLRETLSAEGLNTWPKITGGKGLHVMAPLARKLTHDEAHIYSKRIAQRFAARDPERYVTSAALAKRPGKLFIDYLRNGRGTTAIGTYSPRARPGFPIAAPVTWKDVENGIAPDALSLSHPEKRRAGGMAASVKR